MNINLSNLTLEFIDFPHLNIVKPRFGTFFSEGKTLTRLWFTNLENSISLKIAWEKNTVKDNEFERTKPAGAFASFSL